MIDIDEGFYKPPSLSTAGAILTKNAKGQLVTQKVKVHRYVAGKRPDYASALNDYEEEEQEQEEIKSDSVTFVEMNDRRIRRLQGREFNADDDENDRILRHREVMDPQILQESNDDDDEQDEENERIAASALVNRTKVDIESDEDEELDESELEKRRQLLRLKAKDKIKEEELLEVEEEAAQIEKDDEESEYEESETDEEEDEDKARLKPVFVRKNDRRTVAEREAEEKHEIQLEMERKRMADQRKLQTQKMIEDLIRKDRQKQKEEDDRVECDFNTDDEGDEADYDLWKLRELKRLKRDREEREQREREQQEIERLRNMTEEERHAEYKANPKVFVNKAPKAKYKFLQKYYHRGAFFMDKTDVVYQRDYSEPTLEDHFDKSILPKVMQVKNFGMAGRTKYTHLVDQDTTSFESPWASDKASNIKFHNERGGGMKQLFDRPAKKNTFHKSKKTE